MRPLTVPSFALPASALAVCVVTGGLVGLIAAHEPTALYGAAGGLFWLTVAGALLYRDVVRHRVMPWYALGLGFVFRLLMGLLYIGLVAWFFGGVADYQGYQAAGAAFGQGLLEGEPRFEGKLPTGLTVLFGVFFFLVGADTLGMFLLSALLGSAGAYLVLRACQVAFPEGGFSPRFLALALFTLPSFALWTSVVGKESLMLFFVGITMFSLAKLHAGPSAIHYVGLLIGIAGTSLTRSAVGAIVIFGVLCTLALRRRRTLASSLLRPVLAPLAIVIAAALFWKLALVTVEERFGGAGEQFAAEGDVVGALEYYHRGLAMDSTPGGSMGVLIMEPTVAGVVSYVPQGVFALFFRPFIFEAWNALSFAAAVESTCLLLVLLWRLRRLLFSLRLVVREPFVAFCWIEVILLAVVLSLGSNFGVMIRQRGMVLPFVFVLLSLVPERFRRPVPASHVEHAR